MLTVRQSFVPYLTPAAGRVPEASVWKVAELARPGQYGLAPHDEERWRIRLERTSAHVAGGPGAIWVVPEELGAHFDPKDSSMGAPQAASRVRRSLPTVREAAYRAEWSAILRSAQAAHAAGVGPLRVRQASFEERRWRLAIEGPDGLLPLSLCSTETGLRAAGLRQGASGWSGPPVLSRQGTVRLVAIPRR